MMDIVPDCLVGILLWTLSFVLPVGAGDVWLCPVRVNDLEELRLWDVACMIGLVVSRMSTLPSYLRRICICIILN
jgi:hypothetical protein